MINVFSLIVTGCLLVCANIVILMIFPFSVIGIPDGFGRSDGLQDTVAVSFIKCVMG